MAMPAIQGCIERRILVNFRVEPAALARVLPAPFRPLTIGGFGVGGICLIRLGAVRPRGWPARLGVGSENAAHRIAVEWDEGGQRREGVYIPRRDTDSNLNALLGGRFFPGVHHRADFTVDETPPLFRVALRSRDDATAVSVVARIAEKVPAGSVFPSLEAASTFFLNGCLGYSPDAGGACFEGLELRCATWSMEPLAVEAVHSSFFADAAAFPAGTVAFDSAFLMRDIEHEWVARGGIAAESAAR
ncbi:MAG: DUF2071 domain-containing protein [Planctomycetota bacterium]